MGDKAYRTGICVLVAMSFLLSSIRTEAVPHGYQRAEPGIGNGWQSGQSTSQPPANGANTTQATPDADGIYHVGHGVKPPRIVTFVDPEYTDLARKKKISGVCVVELVVDTDGRPQNVRIVRSIGKDLDPKLQKAAEGLDQNAINAVSRYQFIPSEYQGKPVPVRVNVEVNFKLF
jgi:TonB family protein